MKRVKRVLALLAALALVLAMAVPAFAEGAEATYTLTINNANGTYEAYQIFSGDLSEKEAGKKVLSNIQWGSGVEATKVAGVNAATKAESLTTADIAESFAEDLVSNSKLSSTKATATAQNGTAVFTGLSAGYYLVKNSSVDTGKTYTDFILEVVGNTTANHKGDVPDVEKKAEEKNDSTGAATTWGATADYDVGDEINFELTGTLPESYGRYANYKYVFHDTMTNMTYKDGSVKVYYVKDGKTNRVEISSGFASTWDNGAKKLTVTFNDLKTAVSGLAHGDKIVVTYTATLDASAVVGGNGNPNKVKLEYSNNPNGEGTGETPEKTVVVFTYKTIINKVTKGTDGKNVPLAGAEFTLSKFIASESGSDTVTVNGTEYHGTWNRGVTVTPTNTGNIANVFTFSGLDAGIYRLTETKTPEGYNTIDPVYFEIVATNDGTKVTNMEGKAVNGSEISFTENTTDGSLSADVINNAGTTLPSTGGMGTTVFYVVGGGLMAVAVVLLVTKKRMENKR